MVTSILKQISIVSLVAVLAMGCSKKEIGAPAPTTPTTTNVDGTTTTSTATLRETSADLQVVSHQQLEKYAGRAIGVASSLKVTFNLDNVGQNQYGGYIKISYMVNGALKSAKFSSGDSIFDTQYNKWYTVNGVQKLNLMFEDPLGAILIVINDQVNDLGIWKGEVYYRNYDFGVCSNPPIYGAPVCNKKSELKCWNIKAGPYDCRAYMNYVNRQWIMDPATQAVPGYGSSYEHKGTTYPRTGYQKLGDFYNLDLAKALHE